MSPRLNSVLACAVCVFFWAGAVVAESPLERGTYLVQGVVGCGNCHTPKGPEGEIRGMELAGFAPMDVREQWTVNAPNITPDEETGIGTWSDEEIITAIREGRRPDGSIIGPPMPIDMYRQLSDTDIRAIVAYLRQIPAVHNPVPESEYRIPLPPSYGPPVAGVGDVDRTDPVAYGAYLAGPAGHCIECHSPLGETGPDMAHRLGAGGFLFHGPWGTSVSRNITPTGIGHWSDEEIKAMITAGRRPDGSVMMPPMPYAYYARMTDEDLDAVVAYLRTLSPQ